MTVFIQRLVGTYTYQQIINDVTFLRAICGIHTCIPRDIATGVITIKNLFYSLENNEICQDAVLLIRTRLYYTLIMKNNDQYYQHVITICTLFFYILDEYLLHKIYFIS